MTAFMKNPNLPENDVSSLICGDMHSCVLDYFRSKGIEVLRTKKNIFVDPSVSCHCDISALYLGDGKIIVDNEQTELIEDLDTKGFCVIESDHRVEGGYPSDVILNHAIIGDKIIGRAKSFDKSVKDNINNFNIINVNQGYSKCSLLAVDENSIITDDKSIYENCNEKGLVCLLIEKGDILLPGQEYGFIGGASGKISSDTVIFFGDISKHRNFDDICSFLSERNIGYISFDFPLTDYGGIIPLKEKIT